MIGVDGEIGDGKTPEEGAKVELDGVSSTEGLTESRLAEFGLGWAYKCL